MSETGKFTQIVFSSIVILSLSFSVSQLYAGSLPTRMSV